jgi:hypothetical protein
MISIFGSVPETAFQWSQKAMASRAWGGLGEVGVGVDQAAGREVVAVDDGYDRAADAGLRLVTGKTTARTA